MSDILKTLIIASETAATVARSCCGENLFIAEKCGGEANARFEHDFKTIADVLAQESAKKLITSRFPKIVVRGEECSEIGGVCINLQDKWQNTELLLSKFVSALAIEKIKKACHSPVDLPAYESVPDSLSELDTSDLGVWIDPIDATGEFIAGAKGEFNAGCGLPCVTVLIGCYRKDTGEPIMGVINQPFFEQGKGRIIWGACYNDVKEHGLIGGETSKNKEVLMSAAENPDIIERFKSAGWIVKSVPGAGHKLMKVALGEAHAYIVSKGTTFRWDTCGPHAILKAKGGEILSYTTHKPLTYNDPMNVDTQEYANSEGIIAYSDSNVLNEIINLLK